MQSMLSLMPSPFAASFCGSTSNEVMSTSAYPSEGSRFKNELTPFALGEIPGEVGAECDGDDVDDDEGVGDKVSEEEK